MSEPLRLFIAAIGLACVVAAALLVSTPLGLAVLGVALELMAIDAKGRA